jgi:polysaccharide biosynthesis/export protein
MSLFSLAFHSLRGVWFLFPLVLCACSFDASQRWRSAPKPAVEVTLEYRAKPGDRVQLTFVRDLSDTLTTEYKLQRGDEMRLTVQDREDLSCVSSIAPDGRLYLPYLEGLQAEGLSLEDLRKSAEEKYQPMVKSARVTLIPIRFSAQVDAMLQGLTAPGRPGSVYEATISMDGKAVFPHLGYVQLVGLTPQEISRVIKDGYRARLPGVETLVGISGGASKFLTVLGEMRKPGSFPVEGTVSLTTALGLAEGWLPSSHLSDIVVIRRIQNKLVISKQDLNADLLSASEIQIGGGDLVFVPRSAITDINVFVDQYLRKNVPIPVGVSIPFPGL